MKTIGNFFFGLFCIFMALIIVGGIKALVFIFSSIWTVIMVALVAVCVGAAIQDWMQK